MIEETISRVGLYEAQTPQVFKIGVVRGAYSKLDGKAAPTDDAEVVEKTGHAVSIVESDSTNLKITTKGDLSLANAILKARPSRPVPKFGAFEEAKW